MSHSLTCTIKPEDPTTSHAEFKRVWPWLEASIVPSALALPDGALWLPHDYMSVLTRVMNCQALLWVGEASAIVTEIYDSPTRLRSHHMWLAGGNKDEIVAMVPYTEDWGRAHGCHQQTGSGRKGWIREFTGYEEIGTRKRKSLLSPA